MPQQNTQTAQPAARKVPRTPAPAGGVNVNHCKNPNCRNFGVHVEETAQYGASAYTIVATAAKVPAARCNACGEIFALKSNQGIFEEAWRVLSKTYDVPSCPVSLCGNHRVPLGTPEAYHAFGETKAGSKRWRCKECGKTFSVKPKGLNPIARQIQSDKNRSILSMLTNKMPLKRICEAADVSMKVLHDRIDFFYEQSLAFLAERERNIPDLDIQRLYIGVDRQEHVINWSQRSDKRNVTLSSVAAADNRSNYVFGFLPNYDPEEIPAVVEHEHARLGDAAVGACHRRFARLWLADDYEAAVKESVRHRSRGTLSSDIATAYANAAAKADTESSENFTIYDMLPDKGMLVHSEYTLYGFFIALRKLFGNVDKVRFFLDQDSGMRAACLSAFSDMILADRCDAFFVRITKTLTVDEKRHKLNDAKALFAAEKAVMPGASDDDVRLELLKRGIKHAQTIGPWKDRWVDHPLPSISEPEKSLCHLTDLGRHDPDHLAWLYNKASLHSVDSFFNRVRRRSTMLERPVHSAANRGRVYNAYSAYRPEQIFKMQTIIRACHNYVWPMEPKRRPKAKDGEPKVSRPKQKPETPAMRLGLAKAVLDLNDIIYFR